MTDDAFESRFMTRVLARVRGARVALALGVFILVVPAPTVAQELDRATQPLAKEIVASCAAAGCKRITVADLVDLQGQPSELGRLIADDLTAAIVMARPSFEVIDRANLNAILAEHKLSASGLVDPDTLKRIGKIAGVDAVITGTLAPMSGSVRVSVRAVSVETARVLLAARSELPRNTVVDTMLERGVAGSAPAGSPGAGGAGTPMAGGPSFQNQWVRLGIRTLTKQQASPTEPPKLVASLTLENRTRSEVAFACALTMVDEAGVRWRREGNPFSSSQDGLSASVAEWSFPTMHTLLSSGVPALATLTFGLSQPPGPAPGLVFDLSGECRIAAAGRTWTFPVTIAHLRVAQ